MKRALYFAVVVVLAALAALSNFGMDATGITAAAVFVIVVAAAMFLIMKFGGPFR